MQALSEKKSKKIISNYVSPIYIANAVYLKDFRVIAHQGGTRSGKTYNTINFLIDMCLVTKNLQVSVVSMTVPHLKMGALKDFLEITKKRNIFNKDSYKKSDRKYEFSNGSVIDFFSVDDESKARGSNRDILFINEANKGIKYDVFMQLDIRTRQKVIIDYNPSESQHWIYDKVINQSNCKTVISTYLDNYDFLPNEQIKVIEAMKDKDPLYWRVFGEGQRGMALEGTVFKGWKEIDYKLFPRLPRRVFGLDFGYANDPTAVIEVAKIHNKLYLHEHVYSKGINTNELAELLHDCGITYQDVIIADSANPDAISILQQAGFLVFPAKKGEGSIKLGIDYIKLFEVYYSHLSANIAHEFNYYVYKKNRQTDEFSNVPIDSRNHAIDAIRYACEEFRGLHDFGNFGEYL